MHDWLKRLVHRWFRVPEEPEPPAGDPSSLQVFRASPAYYRYKLIGWAIGQLGTLIGLAVGLALGLSFLGDWPGSGLVGLAIAFFGVLAWLGFLAQVPLSYAALRLDYELRWYMLSDRALRIREGVIRVREMTMTFANIQQISVKQGPLQRLLGIADIEVRTAGGGASSEDGSADMHRGYFRGVGDAETIRDTIRERVRAYRGSGLGGSAPHDVGETTMSSGAAPAPGALEAARSVLAEVRTLKEALT